VVDSWSRKREFVGLIPDRVIPNIYKKIVPGVSLLSAQHIMIVLAFHSSQTSLTREEID